MPAKNVARLMAFIAIFVVCICGYCIAETNASQQKDASDATKAASVKSDEEQSDNSGFEQATFPDTVNHHLMRGGNGEPSISLYYPAFGNAETDAAMAAFADDQAEGYEREVQEFVTPGQEKPDSYDMWDMNGIFTLNRPNPHVVSVTFNIYSYSGGAHGNLLIRCLNYDLRTGKELELSAIFGEPEKAIALLSSITNAKLRHDLGDEVEEDMLQSGTAPEAANFANLSLRQNGLVVEFQPYQVGPWSIGPQHVEVSLDELAEAKPSAEIWPDADKNSDDSEKKAAISTAGDVQAK